MDEIESIRERNRRVELDKAWETSGMRRGIIVLTTYLVVSLFLFIIDDRNPLVHALVPVAGYLLSTWSMPFMKRWWIQKQHD
jgi:hypothetical protein